MACKTQVVLEKGAHQIVPRKMKCELWMERRAHCGSLSLGSPQSDRFPKRKKGNTPVGIHGKWPAARGLVAGLGMQGGQSGQLTIYSSTIYSSGVQIATALMASGSHSNPLEIHGVRGLPLQHFFDQWKLCLRMQVVLHPMEQHVKFA